MEIIKVQDIIYKPTYHLEKNQEFYGVPGEWNVVVTHTDKGFISEHPMSYLDKQQLTERQLNA
jgi:hypothetical protein